MQRAKTPTQDPIFRGWNYSSGAEQTRRGQRRKWCFCGSPVHFISHPVKWYFISTRCNESASAPFVATYNISLFQVHSGVVEGGEVVNNDVAWIVETKNHLRIDY